MSDFIQGQRWLADGEPELGLGLVQSLDERTVTLYFPAVDDERCYALRQPPLTRIRFERGEEFQRRDQSRDEVKAVHDLNGLHVYETVDGEMVPETELADTLDRNSPLTRLLTAQTDHPQWFNFRSALNSGHQAIWSAHLNGLLGTRSTLLPHQLYVATQATERTRVRALLSDEVGLGKTIEAGLIINRLRQQGRASRVLIAVPDALQAQWLVELVRRFSIHCEFFQSEDHDFGIGQVHLIPHRLLTDVEEMPWITAQDWDVLVVDEAHHLCLAAASDLDETESWVALARKTPHLLLLTATPEQLGQEAHFERLQLLDASRFTQFDEYQADQSHFTELSSVAAALYREAIDDDLLRRLAAMGIDWHNDSRRALAEVLDRHGPGRVVYRNTRRGVDGFFPRKVHEQPALSEADRQQWLVEWLKDNRDEKVLLITHTAETAQELCYALWHNQGLDATAFHEGLNLIERDRAAAHFADEQEGAQILVCSEIGGEGRNFQFSHHLILWDLPDHPDVLEQRVGRLDRIGQSNTINIHLPYLADSPAATRVRWYHEVLNCIETLQPAAGAIHENCAEEWFSNPDNMELTRTVRQSLADLNRELEQGRDVMLELNSCRQPEADQLANRVAELEQRPVEPVVEMAANLLNLHFEELDEGIFELVPSDNMMIPTIPGIPDGGAVITFDRQRALVREDVLFVSWEHPLIVGLMDVLTTTQLGQASVALLETKQVPAGQVLLEVQWQIAVPPRLSHALKPYLNHNLLRTLTLEGGTTDLSQALTEESLAPQIKTLPVKMVRKLIQSAKERIPPIYEVGLQHAKKQFETAVDGARKDHAAACEARVERMRYLAGVNPLVNDQDVMKAEMQAEMQCQAWDDVELQPVGVRMILCAPPGNA